MNAPDPIESEGFPAMSAPVVSVNLSNTDVEAVFLYVKYYKNMHLTSPRVTVNQTQLSAWMLYYDYILSRLGQVTDIQEMINVLRNQLMDHLNTQFSAINTRFDETNARIETLSGEFWVSQRESMNKQRIELNLSNRLTETKPLIMLYNAANSLPPHIVSNLAQLTDLSNNQLTENLLHYGLQNTGVIQTKRRRLLNFLYGIE